MNKPDNKNVNHPSHYNQGEIEVIDAIWDWNWGPGFCLGNAVKYIARAIHKGKPKEDLEKAQWYLDYYIGRLEEDEERESKPSGMQRHAGGIFGDD